MTLEDERHAYLLVSKRILKSNLSTNPEKLLQYRNDIIEAHNKFIGYVRRKYNDASPANRLVYDKNVFYVKGKTENCFERLKVSYVFTDVLLEYIDGAKVLLNADRDPNDDNSEASDSDSHDRLSNSEHEQDDNNDEMALTVVEFLNFATKVIPEFDGSPANLQGFIDALNLVNASVGAHVASAVELIKTKLKGNARNYVGTEASINEIVNVLRANIKSESASMIVSKMMNIAQAKKKANDYVKEIEQLSADLKRAYISDGLSIEKADKYVTNQVVQAMKTNASSEKVKLVMQAGVFKDLNEVIDKFVDTCTSENPTQTVSINFMKRNGNFRGNPRPYRGNNRRNFNHSNYSNTNFYNRNSRGRGNNRNNYWRGNSYNSNRNFGNANRGRGQVRLANAQNEADAGNASGPQFIRLRDDE